MANGVRSLAVTSRDGGARFSVRVKPRASRSAIVGVVESALVVSVAAPPVDGETNAELLRLLSRELSVPRKSLGVAAGEHGRSKIIDVEGLSAEDVLERLGVSA